MKMGLAYFTNFWCSIYKCCTSHCHANLINATYLSRKIVRRSNVPCLLLSYPAVKMYLGTLFGHDVQLMDKLDTYSVCWSLMHRCELRDGSTWTQSVLTES